MQSIGTSTEKGKSSRSRRHVSVMVLMMGFKYKGREDWREEEPMALCGEKVVKGE
jgi:hypothetical protein